MALMARMLIATALIAGNCHAGAAAGENPIVPELQAELARQAADGRFSGAVLVAHDGAIECEAAFGEADRGSKQPNTVATKFRFGSMGKMFTAVAIAQLAQSGKLDLEAPLSRYLPDYPNKELAQVTLQQLLTHTAGAGDIFGPGFLGQREKLRKLRDYVAAYGNRAPEFPPGSRHEYSNYGFILLGRVIEVVSGDSYETYVREHVFKPAGMTSTDNLPESEHVAGLAVPYTEGMRSAEDTLPYRGTSAGGGYSTVGDMFKFATALTSNRLLNAKYTALIITGKVETPRRGMKYGYGFEDATLPDGMRRVGHGGGAPGMNGVLSIFPEKRYVVVVLANRDPPAAMEIDRFIARRLGQLP